MRHILLCFLCRQNESERGDLCESCKYRIHRLGVLIDSELQPSSLTPVRSWAKQRLAELKTHRENTVGVK